jgi:hypothetical protein
VKQDVQAPADFTDAPNVLDDAGLVVDMHYRHELRVFTNVRFEQIHRKDSVGIRLEPAHLVTVLFEMFEGIRDGLVLRRHRDQVFAPVCAVMCRSNDCQVVRLGGTRGPDETARVGAKQLGQLMSRILHLCVRFPPGDVDRCRIRVCAGERQA